MFTIHKTFENSQTSVFTVEGAVTDEGLDRWTLELGSLLNRASGHVVLNMDKTRFVSSRAARILNLMKCDRMMLLNEPEIVQNFGGIGSTRHYGSPYGARHTNNHKQSLGSS